MLLLTSPTVPLSAAAATILDRLAAAPVRSALLLDFDGTLAPIVPHPADARLIAGAPALLARLRDRLGLLAFVSGRGLADLAERVALDGCGYAGNHGMEIRRPGDVTRLADEVVPWRAVIEDFLAGADRADAAARGLTVEDKGATLSIHWRQAGDLVAAERLMHAVWAPRATALGLRVTWGRMIMEVRPPVRIDKGTAVRALLDGTGCTTAVYIGDDRTDADAWRALHALRDAGVLSLGAGIAAVDEEVPPEVAAAADAVVAGPPGALAALRYLVDRV